MLDEVRGWLNRFIVTMRPGDLDVLTLWAAHTHLANECYSSPRLLLDSAAPGAGKTTVLDHFARLCAGAVLMGQVSTPAILARLIHEGDGTRTLLLDEVDRNLRPDRPGSEDLLTVVNSGYRRGAVRPVNVPAENGGWRPELMSTFAPVVLAGNSPRLPADTRSRIIEVVMVPANDTDQIEASDWEDIEDDALRLGARLATWADSVRDRVREIKSPDWLKNRDRERWLPLIRTGTAAAGRWGEIAVGLAVADLERLRLDREDEVMTKAPAVQVLHDIAEVWPESSPFVPTGALIERLVREHPDRWGGDRGPLTAQRLGRMLSGKHDIRAQKHYATGTEARGYYRSDFAAAWRRWGVASEPSVPSEPSEPSACSLCGNVLDGAAVTVGAETCTDCERVAILRAEGVTVVEDPEVGAS